MSRRALAVLLFACWLLACSAEPERPVATASGATARDAASYPEERWDDPRTFSRPRMQFLWRGPGAERWTLWSAHLDGSDLRRVAGAELLYAEGAEAITHPPVRSPDHRYVALSSPSADGIIRKRLLDLATRSERVLATGGAVPFFQWHPEGRWLLFYADAVLYRYHLGSEALERMPSIPSRGLYVLEEGDTLLVIERTGFRFATLDGDTLRSEDLGVEISKHHAATSDGRRLMYHTAERFVVIDTDEPGQRVYADGVMRPDADFGPGGRALYYLDGGGVYRLDLPEGGVERVLALPDYNALHLTVFNL